MVAGGGRRSLPPQQNPHVEDIPVHRHAPSSGREAGLHRRQAYIGGRGVKDQSDCCKEGIGPDEVLVLERDVEGTVGARFMLPRSAEPSS